MRLRAHHVGIIVGDLEASKAFYGALGFETVSEMDDGTKTICFMELGGFRLELFAYDEAVTAAIETGARRLGFRHLALRTDDIDGALEQLRSAGLAGPDMAVREVPGLARLLFIRDPDGLEVEIMEDLGAG